jgi:hypothetical protein
MRWLVDGLYAQFNYLQAIVTRHEQIIRERWTKKTIYHRKGILLRDWDNVPARHRPDAEALQQLGADKMNSTFEIAAYRNKRACTVPHVNLEDLSKSESLLLLLNSRACDLPWRFAQIAQENEPFGRRIHDCM